MNFNVFGKDLFIKKWVAVVAICVIALIVGASGYIIVRRNDRVVVSSTIESGTTLQQQTSVSPSPNAAESPTAGQGKKDEKIDEIKVYVTGSVRVRGVVTLTKGQLIDDAIKAAGGALPDADLDNINLAYELADHDMVKIPSKKQSQSSSSVKNSSQSTEKRLQMPVVKDSGGAVLTVAVPGTPSNAGNGKININTASVDELDTLPYIGKETAKDILDYREKNGPFKIISDIMKVTGIKESRYSKIKEKICVE